MLAQHAARVLARGARLGAEAGGPGGIAQGQLALVDDRVGDEAGERHLGGRDEAEVEFLDLEEVVAELGQVARAVERLVAHQERRAHLEIAELARMEVEHELGKRALEPRERSLEHAEAGTRELGRGGEIHEPERLAELPMLLGLEGEVARAAVAAELSVVRLVGADRHVPVGQIGQHGEKCIELGAERFFRALALRKRLLEPCQLGHERCRIAALALALADLARELVALGLQLLERRLRRAPLLVECQDRRGLGRQAAACESAVVGLRILPDPFEVVHGRHTLAIGRPL